MTMDEDDKDRQPSSWVKWLLSLYRDPDPVRRRRHFVIGAAWVSLMLAAASAVLLLAVRPHKHTVSPAVTIDVPVAQETVRPFGVGPFSGTDVRQMCALSGPGLREGASRDAV